MVAKIRDDLRRPLEDEVARQDVGEVGDRQKQRDRRQPACEEPARPGYGLRGLDRRQHFEPFVAEFVERAIGPGQGTRWLASQQPGHRFRQPSKNHGDESEAEHRPEHEDRSPVPMNQQERGDPTPNDCTEGIASGHQRDGKAADTIVGVFGDHRVGGSEHPADPDASEDPRRAKGHNAARQRGPDHSSRNQEEAADDNRPSPPSVACLS